MFYNCAQGIHPDPIHQDQYQRDAVFIKQIRYVTGPRYQCDVSPEVTISYRVVQILVSVSEGPLILSISGFVEYASLFTIQYYVIYKPRYPLHLYSTYQMGFFYCTSSPKLKIKGPVKLDNERKLSGIHSLYV